MQNTAMKNEITGIPVGISNRHIHLSKEDFEILFGKEKSLTNIKVLSQPEQFASEETLDICGVKGTVSKVRIIGPLRSKTQVEILRSDKFKLGIDVPVRCSGELEGSAGAILIGPNGRIELKEGIIVAERHIHMTKKQAEDFGLVDGQNVSIKVDTQRGGTFDNAFVRVSDSYILECHIDTDEANAFGMNGDEKITIVR